MNGSGLILGHCGTVQVDLERTPTSLVYRCSACGAILRVKPFQWSIKGNRETLRTRKKGRRAIYTYKKKTPHKAPQRDLF